MRATYLWVDTEFTGLSDGSKLVEIAAIVTDERFSFLDKFKSVVVHLTEAELTHHMDDWCWENFTKSGLLKEIRESTVTLEQAEEQFVEFVARNDRKGKLILAGNSIYSDLNVLKREMPKVIERIGYRLFDVSALKISLPLYFPQRNWRFDKANFHRAEEDIWESIEEAKYYFAAIERGIPR